MSATVSQDLRFEPKVWSDHSMAYFDKKLVYGQFAARNNSLEVEGSGLTVNFPYYAAIGEAEEPDERESLSVDNLTDDSFSATIFEVGKAVGFKDRSFKSTADSMPGMGSEAQSQIGRVLAEKVDAKLNNEITSYTGSGPAGGVVGESEELYDNMVIGYKAAAGIDTMNIRALIEAKIRAFGDKSKAAVVCFMHSLQFLDLRTDQVAGFLRADANDPYSMIQGYEGKLDNMAIITVDSVPKLEGQIGGQDAYLAHFHKPNSYGIIQKADIKMESDRDILSRENLISSTQWYGVKSFDRKISDLDNKAAGMITTVSKSLAGARG